MDIFSVNDEMVSEFKYKGYLEPLNDTVMTEDILSCYPESYTEHIAMLDGKVYSVPYYMDIMVFWVNKSMIGDMEIRTQEDFQRLLETDFGEGRYGYGRYYFYGRFVPEICPGGNQPGRVLQRRAEHYRWFLKELYANIMFNI